MSEILDFIRVFRSPSNVTLFSEIACYWFASILHKRFPNSSIVYDPNQIHFATEIDNIVYDISGVVKTPEDYIDWKEYSLSSRDSETIEEFCIKLKGGDSL